MNCKIEKHITPLTISGDCDWRRFGVRDPIFLTDPYGQPVKEDEQWVVFFNGRDRSIGEGGITRVGRAKLSGAFDAINVDQPFAFEHGAYAAAGSVVKRGQNDYRLYYSCGTDVGICCAKSADGELWEYDDALLAAPGDFSCTRIGLPFVMRLDDRWIMLLEGVHEGFFRVFAASSEDGESWKPSNNGAPLISTRDHHWDGQAQANPSIGLAPGEGGAYEKILFYNGYPRSKPGEWSLGATQFDRLQSIGAPAPFLTDKDLSWRAERIEGARLCATGPQSILAFFTLPTSDSYKDGAIHFAKVVLEKMSAPAASSLAEEQANDALSQKYFEIWDNYPIQKLTHELESQWLNSLVKPGDRVLLAGSGGGREIESILERADEIVCFDVSKKMLDVGRQRFPDGKIKWVQGDIMAPPADLGGFDVVLALGGVLAYLPDPEQGVVNLSRLLREGGTLTVSVMNAAHPSETHETARYSGGRVRRAFDVQALEEISAAAGMELTEAKGFRFFVDLLPAAWNRPDEAGSATPQILDRLCQLEKELVEHLDPERGKFLWVSAKKTDPSKSVPNASTARAASKISAAKPAQSLQSSVKTLTEQLIRQFEQTEGVSTDYYHAPEAYHPMGEAKYMSSLVQWRKAGWVSDAWLLGRIKRSVKRLQEHAVHSDAVPGTAWGLGFSHGRAPADETYLITTALISVALHEFSNVNDDPAVNELKNSTAQWISEWMRPERWPGDNEAYDGVPHFSPNRKVKVLNAAAYGAYALKLISADSLYSEEFRFQARKNSHVQLERVWQARCEHIGWRYSEESETIDLLHQCYILNSMLDFTGADEWNKVAMAVLSHFYEGERFIDAFSLAPLSEAVRRQAAAKVTYFKVFGDDQALLYNNKPARLWSLGELLVSCSTFSLAREQNTYWPVIALKCVEDIMSAVEGQGSDIDHRQAMHIAHGLSMWIRAKGGKVSPKSLDG